jgi:hypothetical protein
MRCRDVRVCSVLARGDDVLAAVQRRGGKQASDASQTAIANVPNTLTGAISSRRTPGESAVRKGETCAGCRLARPAEPF